MKILKKNNAINLKNELNSTYSIQHLSGEVCINKSFYTGMECIVKLK